MSLLVVITTAQLHSTKPELRFCAGSKPARGVSEIRDGEDLTMVPAGNKAKCLSLVNHTTKTIHQFIMQMPFPKLFLPINSNHSDSIMLSWSYSTNVVFLVKFSDQLFCFH